MEALNQLVQNLYEDDEDRLGPTFAVIDAIGDKIDVAVKAIEAK